MSATRSALDRASTLFSIPYYVQHQELAVLCCVVLYSYRAGGAFYLPLPIMFSVHASHSISVFGIPPSPRPEMHLATESPTPVPVPARPRDGSLCDLCHPGKRGIASNRPYIRSPHWHLGLPSGLSCLCRPSVPPSTMDASDWRQQATMPFVALRLVPTLVIPSPRPLSDPRVHQPTHSPCRPLPLGAGCVKHNIYGLLPWTPAGPVQV